ncbi:peroxisome bioproteinsis factor 10 [Curvularia kusanoi]|uniref:RING-type E3 ubiquitin transferase n=1 Tax=Curvularia kusanoi TaxID=90978 RepID=A0A9P4THQ7_CURKU|nr:peroxisome bioproteinsis factor 10 [Curvularia kusanoi]
MSTPRYTYPYATSPDIIRSHQKDAYFSGVLLERLSTLVRKLYGARAAHTLHPETRVSSELLYLILTTLLGNRTLGEEYCDIVQIDAHSGRLPALGARVGYILSCVLAPYGLGKILPVLRRRVRAKLEANLKRGARKGGDVSSPTAAGRVQSYILANLDTLTSPSPIYALSLATFYFSGSYYHLSKRLWGLRYIFTRQVAESDARLGYEVLGVLLVLQMGVQGYLHLHSTLASADSGAALPTGTSAVVGGGAEVSLDPNAYSANNALLFEAAGPAQHVVPSDLSKWTNTPAAERPRVELGDEGVMGWIGEATRKS